MSSLKKFMLGGIDLKSNDLIRDPLRASDLRNITKTLRGDLQKRNGYTSVETFSGLHEVCYYKTADESIFIKTDGTIWKTYNGARQSCTIAPLSAGADVIYDEHMGSLYFTTTDRKTAIVKYDGADAYLAGLPAPNLKFNNTAATISSPGSTYYYRFFYRFKDLNGNIIYGPYVQMSSTSNTAVITCSTFKTSNPYGKFYNKYMKVGFANEVSPANYTVSSANNFLYSWGTNYVAGDKILIDSDESGCIDAITGNSKRFFPVTVTAITQNAASLLYQNITYTAVQSGPSGQGVSIQYTAGATAGAEVVTVIGSAITVQIESGVSTVAGIKFAIEYGASAGAIAARALVTLSYMVAYSTTQVASASALLYGGYTKVTLSSSELTGITFQVNIRNAAVSPYIDARLKLLAFRSTSESFGYVECSPIFYAESGDVSNPLTRVYVDGQVVYNYDDNIEMTCINASPYTEYSMRKFEDVYEESKQKLRPPLCGYLTTFGDQLVFGNIEGVWDQNNSYSQYNNNDIIMYSDFGFSDSGEGHSANYQKIGDSFDGEVTGLKRCSDSMLITKDNSVFVLDGILEPGGYSLRKIPTDYIGCKSHRSLLAVDGGIIFHGNDGMYFTDGASCKKMSELLDPFFPGSSESFTIAIDDTKTRSVTSIAKKQHWWYMTDNTNHYVLVYDYRFKEWFIWDSLDMSKGIYQNDDKEMVFARGNGVDPAKTYKFNTGFSDDGLAITAYYKSNWEDVQAPSLDKKFKYIRMWNLTSSSTSFRLSVQKNWTNTNLTLANGSTYMTCTIAANSTIQKGHDQLNIQSIRYVMSNAVLDENLALTAYELQFEQSQSIDKGN